MNIDLIPPGNATVKVLSIVGTRPQFVKLAPVCRAIEAHNSEPDCLNIEHRIVNTGQHYEPQLAEVFFEQMRIPEPSYNLLVGSAAAGVQLGKMLERLDPILTMEQPDWVLVYGDTNSTLAGALLAARLHIPLAHVEAGCRSSDLAMPEEQNRILADQLSQLLLAPSEVAVRNLEREGFSVDGDALGRRVVLTGDLTYDALLGNLQLAKEKSNGTLQKVGLESGRYYLLTLHRASNTDNVQNLRCILEAMSNLDLPVLFPIHPRTRDALAAARISLNSNLRPTSPLGYLEMLEMEKHARKILTDSGGVQKEAFYLGVPCVTLRDETEWPETVELGANRIVGANADKICEAAQAEQRRDWMESSPYGKGDAAARILHALLMRAPQAVPC
jgi:UDP-GlcNAc3NAcA epimerase